MTSTRNAAERGAALRAASVEPVQNASVEPVQHVDVPEDVDFLTLEDQSADTSLDQLLLQDDEDEGPRKSPHDAYVSPNAVNDRAEPGAVITLVWPFRNGAGLDNGKRVFMRRPRIIDQLRISNAKDSSGRPLTAAQAEISLFALLTGVLAEEIASLYDFDYRSLQFAYMGFTALPPRRS